MASLTCQMYMNFNVQYHLIRKLSKKSIYRLYNAQEKKIKQQNKKLKK